MTDGAAEERTEGMAALTESALRETYPGYRGQVTHAETLPARDADCVDPGEVLDEPLAEALGHDLWSHQAAALDALAAGDSVVVSTATASGKTLVYALEVARQHLADPASTALLVYPTKALSRDQAGALRERFDALGLDVSVRVYDGDTPQDERRGIRDSADVVITNFAGLNAYLPYHGRWRRVFGDCRLVVVDEAHYYTGLVGMHVAWVVRRFRRLLDYYDADPRFVCTSATIGNPAEHARRLTGVDHTVIDEDGSPRGRRDLVFWKPPVDESALPSDPDLADYRAATTSAGEAGAGVLAHLGLNGVRTLQFCRSRQGTEVAARQAVEAARSHPRDGYLSVDPYHAGLGKSTRRSVEDRLRGGAVDGVTATNALELGIDVGGIDATVLAGYPGSRQSFWQQVGRSGRGEDSALSVLVARTDAIDRYVVENPDYLTEGSVADAVVSLSNDAVYADHVRCAAEERPLTRADADVFGGPERLARAVEMWRRAGEMVGDLDRGVTYDGPPRPQADVSVYAAGDRTFDVQCVTDGHEIDMAPLDRERAYREFHEGALVLHDGVEYEVVGVYEDRVHPTIEVERVSTDCYTETESTKWVGDLRVRRERDLGDGFACYFGEGTVRITYDRYVRRRTTTGEAVAGPTPTGSPPVELDTELLWITTPNGHDREVVERVEDSPAERADDPTRTYVGGLHAAEHGMIKLAPLELTLDKGDLGGLSTNAHPWTESPVWFVHDAVDGGVGFSEAVYDHLDSVVARTRERLAGCECRSRNGCPACVMDDQCGNGNSPLDTAVAVAVLDDLLDRL